MCRDGATVTKLPDAKPLLLVGVIHSEQKVLSKAICAGGDFHPFRSLLHSHNNQNHSKCDYLHTIMCSW